MNFLVVTLLLAILLIVLSIRAQLVRIHFLVIHHDEAVVLTPAGPRRVPAGTIPPPESMPLVWASSRKP